MEQETLIPSIQEQQRGAALDETAAAWPEPTRRATPNSSPPEGRPTPQRAPGRENLGPLLAVAGLCGGAGATTLAYLIGRYEASRDEADVLTWPVLVCDTGGPGGGLAAYSGVELAHSLPRLANAVAANEPLTGGLFADDGSGLRVLASRPRFESDADADGVARLLKDARLAHALTIADCGTLATSTDRRVLEVASHVAWVLPASAAGVARSAGVLGMVDSSTRREMVVARKDPAERKPPLAQLCALADSRQAPLVLMPSVPDLATKPIDDALEGTAVALAAIHSVISR